MRMITLMVCIMFFVVSAGFGQQRATPPPTALPVPQVGAPRPQRPQSQSSIPSVQSPLATAPGPGTIMGYVYWDGNTVKHTPANDCSGLSVSVSAGGNSLGTFSTGHFRYITKAGTLTICAYAIDQMPVGTNLELQVGVTSPAAFSPSPLATGGTASINIMTGKTEFNKCNNTAPAVPSAADLARSWFTCPNYAYNVNFLLTAGNGMLGGNRVAVGKVPPGVAQTANPSPSQGTLLTPGGQRTLLGPQGNSSTDGGRSNLPAAQQPTDGGKDGSFNGGSRVGSGGTLGPGQTMSAPGNAPVGTPLRQPNNLAAPGTTPGNNTHVRDANAMLTVCNEKAMQYGQALNGAWTAISAVNGKAAYQLPGGGGSAPGFPILAAGVPNDVAAFTPSKHYIIQGCGFGSTPGQIFIESGSAPPSNPSYIHIRLYPQQWSDQQIDAEVDPSASGVAQAVGLAVLTAGTTKVLQWGGGVGQATAYGFWFEPNGSPQADIVSGNKASIGNSANSANRLAATQLGPPQTASSPRTMAATTPSVASSPGSVGRASSAGLTSTVSGAYVAASCAKDPTLRILGVSGTPDGATMTAGQKYTIWGCSFGDVPNAKAPSRANPQGTTVSTSQLANNSNLNSVSAMLAASWSFIYPLPILFNVDSWSDNSIVVKVPGPPEASMPSQVGMSLTVKRGDGQQTSQDGFVFNVPPPPPSPPSPPTPVSPHVCSPNNTFRITGVYPDPMYPGQVVFRHDEHYIIRGCAFGNSSKFDLVELNGGNVKVGNDFNVTLRIEFWNDNEIHVTFNSNDVHANILIANSPHVSGVTLFVRRSDGAGVDWKGVAFNYF